MRYHGGMPWSDKQRQAIAARLRAQGKSDAQIRAFFHRHGEGGDDGKERAKRAARRHKRHKRKR